MEYALWATQAAQPAAANPLVLILILMEYALWGIRKKLHNGALVGPCLNPYSNGICSLRGTTDPVMWISLES